MIGRAGAEVDGRNQRPESMHTLRTLSLTTWPPLLFHAGVRRHVRVVVLCGNRVRDRHNVPTELWRLICSFFLRANWAVADRLA